MKLDATIISVFVVVLFATIFLSNIALSDDVVLIEYFHVDPSHFGSCTTCYDDTIDRIIQEIETKYLDQVSIKWFDMFTPLSRERFENYSLTAPPAVVINREYKLSGTQEVTMENLESIINQILGGAPVDSPANNVDSSRIPTLSLVIVSALIDGINPCAFALLVFFLSYLFSVHRSRGSILVMGVAYVAGLFVTYFSIGFGLLQSVSVFGVEHLFGWIGIILMTALGLVTVTDYIKPGKFSIKFPSRVFARAHARLVRVFSRNVKKATLPVALILGGLVGLCEFPCTGGIYYGILVYITTETTFGLAYLALYNFVFILPLIVILLFASNIKMLTKIDTWRLERRRQIKLISGIFMIALGLLVLYWMIS